MAGYPEAAFYEGKLMELDWDWTAFALGFYVTLWHGVAAILIYEKWREGALRDIWHGLSTWAGSVLLPPLLALAGLIWCVHELRWNYKKLRRRMRGEDPWTGRPL